MTTSPSQGQSVHWIILFHGLHDEPDAPKRRLKDGQRFTMEFRSEAAAHKWAARMPVWQEPEVGKMYA